MDIKWEKGANLRIAYDNYLEELNGDLDAPFSDEYGVIRQSNHERK
jgi:hypothetical protein